MQSRTIREFLNTAFSDGGDDNGNQIRTRRSNIAFYKFSRLNIRRIRAGKLFTEFALTLADAVIVSGFVALTLSQMMASKLLRYEQKHNAFYSFGEKVLQGLNQDYRALLGLQLGEYEQGAVPRRAHAQEHDLKAC